MKIRYAFLLILFSLSAIVTSCSADKPVKKDGEEVPAYPQDPVDVRRGKHGKLTGEEGLVLFGGSSKKSPGSGGGSTGIGVNSFLWRATLDTISFMPLASADPFGGIIITDWYADPKTPNERFKLNIAILSDTLRADALRVSVFRQERASEAAQWQDATVNPKTGTDLENKILTRARELRILGN